MRSRFFALFCAVLLLFTGCVSEPKDDFADYEWVEPPAVEGVTMRTEFPEYNGDLETISVMVTNDRDERFGFNWTFSLQKMVQDEWKPIKVSYDRLTLEVNNMLPNTSGTIMLDLKNHVKLPLLPGHYRIWIGTREQVSAEFDVK